VRAAGYNDNGHVHETEAESRFPEDRGMKEASDTPALTKVVRVKQQACPLPRLPSPRDAVTFGRRSAGLLRPGGIIAVELLPHAGDAIGIPAAATLLRNATRTGMSTCDRKAHALTPQKRFNIDRFVRDLRPVFAAGNIGMQTLADAMPEIIPAAASRHQGMHSCSAVARCDHGSTRSRASGVPIRISRFFS